MAHPYGLRKCKRPTSDTYRYTWEIGRCSFQLTLTIFHQIYVLSNSIYFPTLKNIVLWNYITCYIRNASCSVGHNHACTCQCQNKHVLYCIALRCVALYCVALRCVALRCVALRCVALRCVALRCVALRCVALRCIVLHCIVFVGRSRHRMFSDQRHSRRRLTEGMYVILALFTTSRLFIDVITSLRDVYCNGV